jgi:hypothetical protein
VTGSDHLERRYRRWLRWYPTAFRREYEDELLGVLLAGAREGQRRPGSLECLDLLASGLRLRLRAAARRPRRPVIRPVPLMCLGAALELVAALAILATAGDVTSSVAGPGPGHADVHLRAAIAGQLASVAFAAGAAAASWLWMARAIVRGQRWARIAFAALFGVNVVGLVDGLAQGSAIHAQVDLVVGTGICLVQLTVLVLMFSNELSRLARLRSAAGRTVARRAG